MSASLLRLDAISKSFAGVRALDLVSFDLQPGEVHALLGENGAGKSTLIKVITGAHQPDAGTIEIAGARVEQLSPRIAHRLGIAAIYQQPALFPHLSVAENIALALEPTAPFRRVRWRERVERARKLLEQVGANMDASAEVRELSMPEQQLVEIARALGAGARVLIMDEPTASLTDAEVRLLLSVVRELRTRGVGIIYISHRLDEIFEVADRVTVLRDGRSVGTRSVASTSEAELIRLMVGRDVSTIYPPPESAPHEVLLSVRNIRCEVAGIYDVSFDVRAGEVFGLAGLVGAGRTELARVLFGIEPADSGTISLRNELISIRSPRDAIRHGIAYVPEDRRRHGIILEMPIAANTTMAILARLFPFGWLRRAAERQLTEGFIRNLSVKAPSAATPGGALSGGNQQKVVLARWLATEPKVLILDEPTQGVDVGAKAEIHKIIRRLAAEGIAVILISSDLPEILGMSDRIGVMRAGTLSTIFDRDAADAHTVMAAALGQKKAA